MELVATLVLFAILVLGIIKKISLSALFLGVSILALAFASLISGSVLGPDTLGSVFFDIFEFITNNLTSSIGAIPFVLTIVLAYVEVMRHMKAADMLAEILSMPLKKIRAPFLLAGLAAVVSGIIMLAINIGPAAATLLIATLYPVLRKAGCSAKTAATAMAITTLASWGPTNPSCIATLSFMGIDVAAINTTSWFVDMQLPLWIAYVAATSVVFGITSKAFDKSLPAEEIKEGVNKTVKVSELGVPKFYALLPLLPIILLFIFNPLAVSSVKLSIVASFLVGLLVSAIAHMIYTKKAKTFVEIGDTFINGMSNAFKNLGLVVLLAMLFASSMNRLGGMKIIADVISGLVLPAYVLVPIICIFAAVITMIVGSFIGALSIAAPLAASVAAASGLDPLFLAFLVTTAAGVGSLTSPTNPLLVTVTSYTQVKIPDLMKRAVVPIWCGLICQVIVGIILFT